MTATPPLTEEPADRGGSWRAPMGKKGRRVELALIEKRLNCQAELKMKLLLVGSSMVGKTSLISRYANSQADIEALKPTIGDFHHFTVNVAGKCAHVRVWDMGGTEKFHTTDLFVDFYRDVDAILLVFALDDFESFTQLPTWLERIQRHCQPRRLSQLDCCLVANKSDLSARRLVSAREADEFARHHGLPYVEASALDLDNVQKAFADLVLAVVKRRQVADAVASDAAGTNGGRGRAAGTVTGGGCMNFKALCCGCGGARGVFERG